MEEIKLFDKIERFCYKTFYFTSPTFHHYINGEKNTKRIIIIMLIKSTALLIFIRFGLSLSFNTPFILWLTSDANQVLGNRFIISSILCFGALVADLMIGLLLQYKQITGNLYIINHLFQIKKHQNDKNLNTIFAQKFARQLKLISKFLDYPSLFTIVMNASFIFCLPPIVAYLDINSEIQYSVWSIIFWTIITIICLFDFYTVVFNSFKVLYLSTIYVKYQFQEVDQLIRQSIEAENFRRLFYGLKQHNTICLSMVKLNQIIKFIILLLYKFAKPILNLLIYILFASDSLMLTRIYALVIFLIVFSAIFFFNLICTSVTTAAHKPLKTIYKSIKSDKIPIVLRFKIMSFAEKLRDSTIGFYCYDLFPMNNHEFYQYLCGWAYNYFLIINLLKKTGMI